MLRHNSGFSSSIREKRLPVIMSKDEVKKILDGISNLKLSTMLSLMYSCGMRVGELIRLKINDIDSGQMLITIRQSKGKKDRIVPLSPKVLALLRKYYIQYKPLICLFEGQKGEGTPYSATSLRKVFRREVRRGGILKHVTTHSLRHSYATHLLEFGVGLRQIQVILGHQSSKTTEIYTHVSRHMIHLIRSPIDDFRIRTY